MGLIAKLLSFTRTERNGAKLSDVKADPGGGANITGEHFADAGDDSHPLPTDYIFFGKNKRAGGYSPIGYADPINEKKSGPGEKRTYGRDPSSGVAVNEIWQKADGSVILSNALGSFELKADGEALHSSGAKMKTDGDIETSDGISLRNHVHAYTWTDPAGSGSTNPPT